MEILQGSSKTKNSKESAKPNAEEAKAKQRPQRPQRPKPEATETEAGEDDNEGGSVQRSISLMSISS